MQPRIIVLLRIRVTKISLKSLIEKIRVRTIIRGNTVSSDSYIKKLKFL